jgi:polysaccharide biosynthesis protein PslG
VGAVPVLSFVPAFRGSTSASAEGAVVTDGRQVGFSLCGCILSTPAAERNADLDRIKAVGATWVRLDFNWTTLEMHGKGQFNFGPADDIVRAANARGLQIDAEVSYTPYWARPAGSLPTTPPTRLADYSEFLHAAVRHFAPMGVHTWEIWNEPNMQQMWSPRPDVAKYAQLLKLAYPAIKSADPSATVVTAGMSPAYDAPDGSQVLPLTWVKGLYANGAKGYFDAIGHHPSSYPSSSNLKASWNAFQQTTDIYDYMRSQGDGNKKIWATEIAFPTGTSPEAVSEQLQGERFAESLEAWHTFSFHGPIFIYTLRDYSNNAANSFDTSGLFHFDGSPKVSVTRITQALRAPQHVHAIAGAASARVAWDAPGYDYGSPITSYTVVASRGGATVTVDGDAREANVLVTPGVSYTFTVRPNFGSVPGVASVASNAVTPSALSTTTTTAPPAPTTTAPPVVTTAPPVVTTTTAPRVVTTTTAAPRPTTTTAPPATKTTANSLPVVYPTTGAVAEGDSGSRTVSIPVILTTKSRSTITVRYRTQSIASPGNAVTPQDYVASSGTLRFTPGEKVQRIRVTIRGDRAHERNEQLLVLLSNAVNAKVGGFYGIGVGTIVNDD